MIDLHSDPQFDLRSNPKPIPHSRPLALTFIVAFQVVKASFLVVVAVMPWTGHENGLAYIPNLPDLVFLASHGKANNSLVLFVLGIYAGFVAYGLWNLRLWARNSLVFASMTMLALYLAHFLFGTALITMPAVSLVETQTVYILLLFDFFIFMYLRFHDETARCFPAKQRY